MDFTTYTDNKVATKPKYNEKFWPEDENKTTNETVKININTNKILIGVFLFD